MEPRASSQTGVLFPGAWAGAAASMALHTTSDMLPNPKGLGQGRATWQGTRGSGPCLPSCRRQPDHFCLPRVQAIPRTVPGSGSTHLAGGGRPGTSPHPRRAPRCRSSPPAWSALAGGLCTVERGPEDQASVGQGGDALLSTAAGWCSSGRASMGDYGLGSEAGTALPAQLRTRTWWDQGCGLRQ